MNLANVPEARSIEDFWAIMKRIVYKDGWTAQRSNQVSIPKYRCQGCTKASLNSA